MSAARRSARTSHRKRGWGVLGQGVVEYTLMLVFTGLGLVFVTGAAYNGLNNRVDNVVCNMGNEGREVQDCTTVGQPPNEPPSEPPSEPPIDPETPDTPPEYAPPIASFVCVCDGLDCFVDGQASYDQDEDRRSIVGYAWDFGNGAQTDLGPQTFHTFPGVGSYPVSLSVTDDEGDSSMTFDTCEVSLESLPPIADFTHQNVPNTLQVDLDGDPSYDQDEAGDHIVLYEWDIFNDGSIEYTGEEVSHIFETGGTFPVRLIVTDDEGDTAQTVKNVAVGLGPVPIVTATCEGLDATFDGSESYDQDNENAENNGIIEWRWTFAEGATEGPTPEIFGVDAAAQSPTVTFTSFGTHTATLMVTDSDFNTATAQVDVFCGNQPPLVDGITLELIAGAEPIVDVSTRAFDAENDPLTATWYDLPQWVLDGASLDPDNTTLRYQVAAPIDSAGNYVGQVCVNDGFNEDVCAEVRVIVVDSNAPDITVQNYELYEGLMLVDDQQFAYDADVNDTLTITYEGLPGFVTQAETGTSIPTTQELGTHQRVSLQYDLAPQLGDAGTYNVTACVSDGISQTCKDFVIDVLVPVDGTAATCPTFPDFDTLPPGTQLGDQFDGMRIFSLPKGYENRNDNQIRNFQEDHPIWTYDSENRVNPQDGDLGTPNRAFTYMYNGQEVYGKGYSSGSQRDGERRDNWAATVIGGPYVNDTPLANLLIIQEDAQGLPDDNAGGGIMVFEFDYPAVVGTIRFVDVDDGRPARVTAYDANGNTLVNNVSPNDAGENTVVPLVLDQNRIARLEIEFPGSGAIDGIFFCDQYEEINGEEPGGSSDDSADDSATVTANVRTDVRLANNNNQDQRANFRVRVFNDGDVALNDVSFRTYFTPENGRGLSDYVFDTYWDQAGGSVVTGPFDAGNNQYYFQVDFTKPIAPGSRWQFNGNVRLSNWARAFDASNDWSFANMPSSWGSTDRFPVYMNGTLVGGSQP